MRIMDVGVFSFCVCKETEVKDKRNGLVTGNSTSAEFVNLEKCNTPTNSITDHQDIQVCFSESSTEYMKQCNDTVSLIVDEERDEKAPTLEVSDTKSSKQNCQNVLQKAPQVHSERKNLKNEGRSSGVDALCEEIRAKRVALRKLHAKLKIELNNMQKMRDTLNDANYGISANLPQVIAETDKRLSEEDFIREFRKLFENFRTEITQTTKELEGSTHKHKDMLAKSANGKNHAEESGSQMEGESQRLIGDSGRLLSMLQKAIKIATVEHNLKVLFSETPKSPETHMSKLESALLDLQRLKSTCGLEFYLESKTANSSSSYSSARETFSELFPQERILKLEKKSKIKLAELHISALENQQMQNEMRQKLEESMKQRNKEKLSTTINDAVKFGLDENDEMLQMATTLLKNLSEKTLTAALACHQDRNLKHEIEEAQKVNTSKSILQAPTKTKVSDQAKDRIKSLLSELRSTVKTKDPVKIQQLLVDIKSIRVGTNEKIVEEALSLLISLKQHDKGLSKDAKETTRAGLLSSIESQNTKVIADFLIRAHIVGLKNCIEIMGAKAKLAQLQKDKKLCSAEVKKIEEHLEKNINRASDVNATVDLIMTLERAITVAELVDVSATTKQKAKNAMLELKARKQKVKDVKDELQRAVMECRHEAITCAIAEADSLPYFLKFDPLDGQIAAILDYAKNKISPHEGESNSDEPNPAEKRVKSNLKRAMKGHSSAKLESAISLFRKTYNVTESVETAGNKHSQRILNEETRILIQRAERKHKRMKKQEQIAEKEWITVCNAMRENLRTAMNGNDRAELWRAVYQFKRELGSNLEKQDENLLLAAKKQLREVTIQQCKANLSSAVKDRDSARLRHSLVELESPSLFVHSVHEDHKFKDDIERAKKLLGHLKDMDRLKKSVAQLTRSQLAEIHRYPNPPSCVQAVMRATYVLLGENEKELKDWSAVLRLLVRMGRESLPRRIAVCTPSCISAATASRAKDILFNLGQVQVQDVNKTAAIFYGWAKCVIAEVLDRYQDNPEGEAQFKRKNVSNSPKPKDPPTNPVKSEFWNRLSRPRSSATSRPVRTIRSENRPISAAA